MSIPQTFDEAFARVKELVAIFKANEPAYTGPRYNEADARKDFIDKFWIALGWDVNHEQQTDPYKQDVKVERGVASVSEKQAWEWLKQNHAGIADHLESFEDALQKRQDQGNYFWELRPCDYYSSPDAPKIIFPDICKAPRFCVDRSGIYLVNTAYCLGTDSLYLLGLLNSRLFWFAIANISIPFGTRAGEYRYRLIYQYMERVPVRPIDAKRPADTARHDRIVQLVDQMLEARKQLASAQTIATRLSMKTSVRRSTAKSTISFMNSMT